MNDNDLIINIEMEQVGEKKYYFLSVSRDGQSFTSLALRSLNQLDSIAKYVSSYVNENQPTPPTNKGYVMPGGE